jgi:hypothetical protein
MKRIYERAAIAAMKDLEDLIAERKKLDKKIKKITKKFPVLIKTISAASNGQTRLHREATSIRMKKLWNARK